MTRVRALAELAQPISQPDQVRRDIKFVAKKLGLTREALEALIDAPAISHYAYPNQMGLHTRLNALKGALRRITGPTAAQP